MANETQEKILNTVIVLRHDTKTAWETDGSYKLREGEVGVGYMTVEQRDSNGALIEDTVDKYVPIVKIGAKKPKANESDPDEFYTWSELPQAEGIFEDDITLTYAFGRHKLTNGLAKAGGKGMTVSEWIKDALSEVYTPEKNNPYISTTVSGINSANGTVSDAASVEVGTCITQLRWAGSYSTGTYKSNNKDPNKSTVTHYGIKQTSNGQINKGSNVSGLTSSMLNSWTTYFKYDSSVKTTDSKYTNADIAYDTDGSTAKTKTGEDANNNLYFSLVDKDKAPNGYVVKDGNQNIAQVKQTVTYKDVAAANAAVNTPLNNVGDPVADSYKISVPANGHTSSEVTFNVSGFRYYWYGYVARAKAGWDEITKGFTEDGNNTLVRTKDGVTLNGIALTQSSGAIANGWIFGGSDGKTHGLVAGNHRDVLVVVCPKNASKSIKDMYSIGSMAVQVTDTSKFKKLSSTNYKLPGANGLEETQYDILYYLADDLSGGKLSVKIG